VTALVSILKDGKGGRGKRRTQHSIEGAHKRKLCGIEQVAYGGIREFRIVRGQRNSYGSKILGGGGWERNETTKNWREVAKN